MRSECAEKSLLEKDAQDAIAKDHCRKSNSSRNKLYRTQTWYVLVAVIFVLCTVLIGTGCAAEGDPITVSVEVDSSRAVEFGYESSLFSGDVEVKEGQNVYDALVATGLAVGGDGGYVNSISGLSEKISKEYPGSGWIYSVNDEVQGVGAGSYTLSGGEKITFTYSLSYGEDLNLDLS